MCGGTTRRHQTRCDSMGLSPRVRGNQPRVGEHPRDRGSIPACAGEPSSPPHGRTASWVYPRVCGGTPGSSCTFSRVRGLSPRVRGNRRCADQLADGEGSIPACAGEPESHVDPEMQKRVYPRVCGGTVSDEGNAVTVKGLSPRVRGNPGRRAGRLLLPGSIPACAGEPRQGLPQRHFLRVYPRVCGGTYLRTVPGAYVEGLSPRVRGNHYDGKQGFCIIGSIPACAGEPDPRHRSSALRRVYPRVCGGTSKDPSIQTCPAGLSPRVRGNRGGVAERLRAQGSIPACAGEPRSP